MKNPFKPAGFDTHIGSGVEVRGSLILPRNTATVIDGRVFGESIVEASDDGVDSADTTTLTVAGLVKMSGEIRIQNIVVSGVLKCDTLIVGGQLAVNKTGRIEAKNISYNTLVIQTGATIIGNLAKEGDKDGDSV